MTSRARRKYLGAVLLAFAVLSCPALASAQQEPASPDPSPAQADGPRKSGDDRLLWVMPNVLTVRPSDAPPPLSARQKFGAVATSTFDLFEYPWYAATATVSQVNHSEPGFGQGASGYVKRYGANFTDGTIENFMVGAVLPSILHQDPRYYEKASGGVARRALYAVSRMAVTRTDKGKQSFNYSELIGSGIAAALANTYHPVGDRTVRNTLSVWRTLVGYDALTALLKEFWPDIRRSL